MSTSFSENSSPSTMQLIVISPNFFKFKIQPLTQTSNSLSNMAGFSKTKSVMTLEDRALVLSRQKKESQELPNSKLKQPKKLLSLKSMTMSSSS